MTSTREGDLLRLIHVLWTALNELTSTRYLESQIRKDGLGWALPTPEHHHDDDWLTVDQIAFELGYSQSAIRNWPSRYGLKPVNGRYRWGDIQSVRQRQVRRRRANATAK
ncbi:hypothetical protein [Mycolicibacterium mageritense]|uniref:DNA-binding protein n=1 Tax=Mycolicibacterium mageritense TaxID=53462 RepID=A0AAI8XPX0_MYCME|nr:hypothetical protein [Mycolicibacterium mageritense]BDY33174.1 hypothetical protein hbim_07149 [Mycolicibacterium mageritense]